MYENSLKKAWKAKSMSLFSGRSCFGHDSVVLDMRASDMFGHVLDMRASVAFSRNIFGVAANFSARRPIGPARLHGLISCVPVFSSRMFQVVLEFLQATRHFEIADIGVKRIYLV